MNRNIEGFMNNKGHFTKEIQALKDELDHVKSLNVSLKENL